MIVPPERKYSVLIEVAGDSWDDVAHEIEHVCREVVTHGEECGSVSGGYSTNHTVQIIVNPEMNHDIYFERLQEYLAATRDLGHNAGEGKLE